MTKRIKFFSLIEIIIVIIIITISASVIGIKVSSSIKSYQYDRTVKRFKDKIKFARNLAYVNQNDVFVNLLQKKNDLYCEIGYVSANNESNSPQSHHIFSNVNFVFKSDKKNDSLTNVSIIFFSSGDFYPKGSIYLTSAFREKRSKSEKIDLTNLFIKETIIK